MLKLKPEFLKTNGKTQFVILTAKDFRAMEELIEDALDVRLLQKARENDEGGPGLSLDQMKRRLGMKSKTARQVGPKRRSRRA